MEFSKTAVAGNGNLLIEGMQSPNFSVLAGTGWQINKDGSATFYSISLPNLPGSGTKVTFSSTAPPGPNVGDVWYDTAAGLLAQQWSGTAWVPYSISAGAVAAGDTVNPNPYFAGGDLSHWAALDSAGLTAVTTSGVAFPWAAQITCPPGVDFPFIQGDLFACAPGDPLQVSGWLNAVSGGASLGIVFFDSGGGFISQTETDVTGGWQPVTSTGTAPAGTASAALYVQINSGVTIGTETVQCTALTVLTKVDGANLIAGTVTADQIKAGIVLAGVVDSTTINGAVFNGTDFIFNQNGLFIYSGTPGTGNLIATIAPAAGTDPVSGQAYVAGIASYNGGLTVQLSTGTAQFYPFTGTPNTPGQVFAGSTGHLTLDSPTVTNTDTQTQAVLASKAAIGSGLPSGALQVTDPIDGTVYVGQIVVKDRTSDSASLTGLTTVLSSTVGARRYRIHGMLFISATSGAQLATEITLPSGAGGKYSVTICRSTTFVGQVTGPPNTSNGISVTLATATYAAEIDGILTVTSSGALNFQAGSLTGTGLVIQANSFIDLVPV